jgi:hypothetical protein
VASTFRVLAVGGLRLAVEAPPALPWRWPRGPLRRFAAEGGRADVRVRVRVARPEEPPPASLRYDSGGGIFDVAQVGGDLVVALRIRGVLQRTARFDAGLREGEVVVAPDSLYARECWYPLAYPLDEVVFLHRILREGGLLVHACGVVRGRRGLVFTGPSGAGKTTIARLLARHAGARVLSDDRVVLRPGPAGRFRIFGTPWHGDGALSEAGSATLAAVHAIHHAPEVRPEPLAGAAAAAALLANAFVPAHDPIGAAAALDLAAALVERTPVLRLGFAKDARVAAFAFPAAPRTRPGGARPAAAA